MRARHWLFWWSEQNDMDFHLYSKMWLQPCVCVFIRRGHEVIHHGATWEHSTMWWCRETPGRCSCANAWVWLSATPGRLWRRWKGSCAAVSRPAVVLPAVYMPKYPSKTLNPSGSSYEGCRWGSGGRAGHPLIGGSAVHFPALPVRVSMCPWARYLTRNRSRRLFHRLLNE